MYDERRYRPISWDMVKPKKKYWYKTEVTECVLCGRQTKHRYRVYGDKPNDAAERYIFKQDVCATHFI